MSTLRLISERSKASVPPPILAHDTSITMISVYCLSGALTVLSDIIVIVVTWHRTRTFGKPIRSNHPSIMTLMFHDGVFIFPLAYFCEQRLFTHMPHCAGTVYFM